MAYQEGCSNLLRFKSAEAGEVILCFWGDTNAPEAQFAMDASGGTHPRHAQLEAHQTVSLYLRFPAIRPYGEVFRLADEAADRFEAAGWEELPAIEGLPDTGSAVMNLVDTAAPGFYGFGSEFPGEPSVHGYNAAGALYLLFGRPDQPARFSQAEIDHIRQLAETLATEILGSPVSLSEAG